VIIHLLAGRRRRLDGAHPHGDGARRGRIHALTILTRNAVYGVRDPWGLRPLVLGELPDGGHVLASESCAFATIGAATIHEMQPGEIVRIDARLRDRAGGAAAEAGLLHLRADLLCPPRQPLQRASSVHQTRQKPGQANWPVEAPVAADIVVPVPDSGTPHAIGYAQKSGIPYSEGLIKSRYIGRTFIQPSNELRKVGVAMKFNPLPENLQGQAHGAGRRLDRARQHLGPLVQDAAGAGAKEVHVRVACPPIKFPCFMGVDMASQDELIAANKSVDEICAHIGADSLAFSVDRGLMRALKAENWLLQRLLHRRIPLRSTPIPLIELQEKEKFAGCVGRLNLWPPPSRGPIGGIKGVLQDVYAAAQHPHRLGAGLHRF
jgi:amidophosphoribosyltransferase